MALSPAQRPVTPVRRNPPGSWCNMRAIIRIAIVMLALISASCATVEPWERGRLAQTEMALDIDPLAAELEAHTYFSKEGATGGVGTAGGGCGCN